MRRAILGLCLVMGFGLLGCSKGESKPVAGTNPADAPTAKATGPASQALAVPASATAEQVVQVFLNALKKGDSPTTESLLTAKARQELGKHEMHVDVQPAPDAVFQVDRATIVPNEPSIAHVNTVWTERFQSELGQPVEEQYRIVWGLRQQPEGWRVAGMQVELVPGMRQYLDFENPEDMLKKRDEALAALHPPAAQTAQQPQTPAVPAQYVPVQNAPGTIDR
jgi:hypothetical protein